MKATEKIEKARVRMMREQPFYAVVLVQLRQALTDRVPTMGVDGRNLFINLNFVDNLTDTETFWVIVHEVLHVTLGHVWRMRGKDSDTWNQACDYWVNHYIINVLKGKLPSDGLYDDRFTYMMSAEEIYNELLQDKQKTPSEQCFDHTSVNDMFVPSDDEGNPLSEKAIEDIKNQIEQVVEIARAVDKLFGNDPGDTERLLKANRPKVPWTDLFSELVRSKVNVYENWSRPNPRVPVYTPSKAYEGVGTIVIGNDTSGSMGSELLSQSEGEIAQILESVNPQQVYVLDIDTKVRGVYEWEPGDNLELHHKGGGGTKFSPVFEWCKDEGIEPDLIVYFTDGYARDYGDEPNCPVIWATYGSTDFPFGDVIEIK